MKRGVLPARWHSSRRPVRTVVLDEDDEGSPFPTPIQVPHQPIMDEVPDQHMDDIFLHTRLTTPKPPQPRRPNLTEEKTNTRKREGEKTSGNGV
jgi:hypothetical protein